MNFIYRLNQTYPLQLSCNVVVINASRHHPFWHLELLLSPLRASIIIKMNNSNSFSNHIFFRYIYVHIILNIYFYKYSSSLNHLTNQSQSKLKLVGKQFNMMSIFLSNLEVGLDSLAILYFRLFCRMRYKLNVFD
jgi:hypothetical protein